MITSCGGTIIRIGASLLVLFAMAGCRGQNRPVAVREPIVATAAYEEQSEALAEWMRKGYRGMVVVNVDYDDDLGEVPPAKIKELKRLYGRKEWESILASSGRGADSLYTPMDYLYPAYKLGLIEELYWVTPSRLLEAPDLETGLREFLMAFGYGFDVINTFKRDGQAMTGSILGMDVTITSVQGLPKLRKPVILCVDLDYFSNRIEKGGMQELDAVREFITKLSWKELKVERLDLEYSLSGSAANVTYRHLGEELLYLLGHPEVIRSGDYPRLWKLRGDAFGFLRLGQPQYALDTIDEGLADYAEDNSLRCARAIALALLGRDAEAKAELQTLSASSKAYSYTYLHIARELQGRGDARRAEDYFKLFLARYPSNADGMMAYGNFLYNAARDEEALAQYNAVLSERQDIYAIMYAGDALFQLGRYAEARRYYEEGLILLDKVGYASMRDFTGAMHNIETIKFKGL